MEKYICECGREFKSNVGLKCHKNKCDGNGTPRDKKRKSKGNHQQLCPKCNNIIGNSFLNHFKSCDGTGPRRKSKYPNGKGRKFTKEHKENLSKSNKGKISWWHKLTNEEKEIYREKARNIINKRYANGWQPKCGRCPKYEYNSPIAGKIKVDGSWELKVCEYLDNLKVSWNRNKKRFTYINLEGTESTYCPDFWVESWQKYIEVKGYKTDLDDCKWSQFKEPLEIWDQSKLEELKILEKRK